MSARSSIVAALAAGSACLASALPSPVAARAAHARCSHSRAGALLCAMNATRHARGLPPLRLDARLRRSAAEHARDMVARKYFAHTSPDGVTFRQRVAATGWTRGRRSWSIGENLAWGSGSEAKPAAIVAAWMHSPPHRRILLDRRFAVVGIGIADGTPVAAAPSGATFAADFGS